MRRPWPAVLAILLLARAAFGSGGDDAAERALRRLPPYRPAQSVTGTIRLWGHGSFQRPFMRRLVNYWEAGFRRFQRGARIEYDMYGTSSAIPALYAGAGDLSILGEELDPGDAKVFREVTGWDLESVQIATGSVGVRNADYAQMFFVRRDNPLRRITLAQLDGIFGAEHRRGAGNLRSWGELGLGPRWADRPIHPYGWAIDDSFGIFLERTLLRGSHRWNCALREYRHLTRPDGSIYDHGQQILDALARDPDGIAVSNIRYAGPDVAPLALAADESGPSCEATAENLIAGRYPLTRWIPACFPRHPGQPLDPKVREFLRYILSREGQADIVRDGSYLPLNPRLDESGLEKLNEPGAPTGSAGSPLPVTPGEGEGPLPVRPAPPYRANHTLPHLIRIWGDPGLAQLAGLWERAYRRIHPEIRFENRLIDTAMGMPGIYLGIADLAFLGREPNVTDRDGFAHVRAYAPTRFEIATGSLASPGKSPALAVFVHRGNPLERAALRQLAAVFGCGGDREAHPRTWKEFGLGGAWAGRPVHPYLIDIESGTGQFFLDAVLGRSHKLNWAEVTEFADGVRPDGTRIEAGARVMEALRDDPLGLAISTLAFAGGEVRPLALAENDRGPFLTPTEETLGDHSYPLTRTALAFVNRPPGRPIDPKVAAFLRFLYGEEAARAIRREGAFLPLPAAARNRELARLD